MKAIFKNWIWCAIALAAALGGCAAHPHMKEPQPDFYVPNFSVGTNSGSVEWFSQSMRSISGSGADEVWVIPRNSGEATAIEGMPDSGALLAEVRGGETPLPLSHTDVKASVTGFIGTVDVTQQFENPYTEKIEATYVFPLPHNAAINEFIMTIGKRRIRGIIRERKDAEAIYEEAKRQGYRATLLTEDRPNIFRQSIANIEPGNEIDVNIKYFQTLDFRDGWFEFVFPIVASSQFESQTGDVSLQVDVEAGAPIQKLESETYAIAKTILSPTHVIAHLKHPDSASNRDFLLRYRLADGQSQSSLLMHRDERGGFFSLILFPPKEVGNLTNVKIDWGAMGVSEVIPAKVPDLISGHPLILTGRFNGRTNEPIRVLGDSGRTPMQFEVSASSLDTVSNDAVPNLWARMKIAELTSRLIQSPTPELRDEINQISLDYGILSPFTSFMAVDASEVTKGNAYKTVPAASGTNNAQ